MHPIQQAQAADEEWGLTPAPKADVLAFHGGAQPAHEIQNEKPIHRVMAHLAASGHSKKEIAEQTGYSYAQVLDVHRQDWFKTRVATIIAEASNASVQKLLTGGAVDAVMKLHQLLESDSDSVALSAAKDILDRTHGKSVPMERKDEEHVPADPQDEIDAIKEELKQLKGE